MSDRRPVSVIQANNTYSSSTTANPPTSSYPMSSAVSSYTHTSSSSSRQTYLSSSSRTSSSPRFLTSHCPTRPAEATGETPYGKKEFVYTGRPQGGNPHGGPEQHPEGYIRISNSKVTVHNSGGISMGGIPVQLGPEFGNGPGHSEKCRDLSRWSDNQGLCFCPTD